MNFGQNRSSSLSIVFGFERIFEIYGTDAKTVRLIFFFFRAIVHVFEGKEVDEDRDTQYFIHVSYVEIYNEEIRDLLSDNPERKLEIKGNAVQGTTNKVYNKHCGQN